MTLRAKGLLYVAVFSLTVWAIIVIFTIEFVIRNW